MLPSSGIMTGLDVATVRMLAFAGARDAIGAAEVELAWSELVAVSPERTPTADDLLALACARWPTLAPYRSCLRVAVNGSYAASSDPVSAGDEVALIPPVAGG